LTKATGQNTIATAKVIPLNRYERKAQYTFFDVMHGIPHCSRIVGRSQVNFYLGGTQ
jgi:hypothetical protein